LSTPLSQIIAPCFFFLCSWVHMYVCIHVLVKQLVKFHAFGICDDLNEQ
jgi:intracellular septation protein A